MTEQAQKVLDELMQGNERFRTGRSIHRTYEGEQLEEIAKVQRLVAAVVSCGDSRLSPEVIFDQPLGQLFVSRVPANVASDGTKWLIDIAVEAFHVPLVIVLGHTGCIAVSQVVDGNTSGPGSPLRIRVVEALYRAKAKNPDDLYRETVEENARVTVEHLKMESSAVAKGLSEGSLSCLAAVYEMDKGNVQLLD